MDSLRKLVVCLSVLAVSMGVYAQEAGHEHTDTPHDTIDVQAFLWVGENIPHKSRVPVDTAINDVEIFSKLVKNPISYTYLGNYGTSYVSNLFYNRPNPSQFTLTDNIEAYIRTEKDNVFHKTRTPYSHLTYLSGPSRIFSEQTMHFVHTQNVNEFFNVGLEYDGLSSEGFYENQKATSNGLGFNASHEDPQYYIYGALNFNWHKMRENGGLSDVDFFMSPDNDRKADAQPVRLTSPKTQINATNFFLTQGYKLGKYAYDNDSIWGFQESRFAFEHLLEYKILKRGFHDSTIDETFFGQPTQTMAFTADSAMNRSLSNSIYLVFNERERNKITAGFKAGVVVELEKFGHNSLVSPDSLALTTHTHNNFGISGSFFNYTGKLINWDVNGRFYLSGYRSADFELNGSYSTHLKLGKSGKVTDLELEGNILNRTPECFIAGYGSNFFNWENSFDKERQLDFSAAISRPEDSFRAGFHFRQIQNYIYFDQYFKPAQTSDGITMFSIELNKNFMFWRHLGVKFQGVYQKVSDQDLYPVPDFSGYQSTYYEGTLVKNVLTMQVGYDLYYNTKFYGFAYQPATGVFGLQPETATPYGLNRQEIGGYPYVDLFLNFKLKRARIFVKYEHANESIMGESLRHTYFTALGYAEHPAMFRLGISWGFYD